MLRVEKFLKRGLTALGSIALLALLPAQVWGQTHLLTWGSFGPGIGEFKYPQHLAADASGNVYVGDSDNHRVQKFDSNGTFITEWGTNGSGNGEFQGPYGIAVDASGNNVYVVDRINQRVQKFDSNGTFITEWGTNGSGNGEFTNPAGVAVDALGNVYVVDTGNHRVQVFDSSGTFITKWGTNGFGDGEFDTPVGIVVDALGNVYVADHYNHRVQVFDSSGTFITKWGVSGTNDGEFNLPSDIVLDAAGNVYVTDLLNHRVQVFDSSGTFITKWGTPGPNDGEFNQPNGIAVSGGAVYVIDILNHRVQKFSQLPGPGDISTVAGIGTQGSTGDGGQATSAELNVPHGVAVDVANNVFYIGDQGGHRVRKVDLTTGVITTIAGNGGSGFGGDGGPATSANIQQPYGVDVDAQGNLYIAATGNQRVRKVDVGTGIITTVAGTGTNGSGGDGGQATSAELSNPLDVAVDGQNLYIAEQGNHRLRKVDLVSGIITTVAGDGTIGVNDGPLPGRLNQPYGVDVDVQGNLYIADYGNHRLRKVDLGANTISTVAGNGASGVSDGALPGQLFHPRGLVVGPDGNVYIGDSGNYRVRKVDLGANTISTVAGDGTASYGGDGGPATSAQVNYPTGVDFDGQGNLYIGSHFSHRIRKVEAAAVANFTITASAGANGQIAPPGATAVNPGANQSYTITADAGYHVDDVLVDGGSVGAVSTYDFLNIQANHTIDASFALTVVTISAAPPVTATYNQALTVPVTLSDATGVIAAELTVEYDTALLTLVGASSTGTLTDGWSVETNTQTGGGSLEQLIMAMATDQSAAIGAQTLIELDFTVNDVRAPASSVLALSGVLLNDGNPPNVTIDGLVTLVGNDGSIGSLPAQFIPRDDLTITVIDLDADLDGLANTDQVTITATNLTTSDQITGLVLSEDAATAGTFTGTVSTEFGTSAIVDALIQAQAGEIVEVSFSDALDGNGAGPIVRTAQSTAIGGVDGTVQVTDATQPGDVVYIKVTDADLNTSFSSAETAQVVITSSNGESEVVLLTEVDVDDDVFFGSLNSASGASAGTDDDGTINGQKGDVLTATYDDVVTALGDQLDRIDADQVVDPFGDADGNASVQAFDAAQALFHVLSPFLTGLELIQANVDTDPAGTGITPFDASLILQKRVGLISVFPVQLAASTNHPQSTPASPKWVVGARQLALEEGEGYLSLVADERAGVLSGEIVLAGVERVELAPAWGEYLIASRPSDEGLWVVFAGARSVAGAGEVLRLYGSDLSQMRVQRTELNDGQFEARVELTAPTVQPLTTVLRGNYPNPFNPETSIRFDLAEAGPVRLHVFDALGQKVKTLVDGSLSAGTHQAVWRGVDQGGRSLSSGMYFYRLEVGSYSQARKMLLMK
jgi:DNA-binding beta-propeller fold protein YncE